MTDDIQSLIDCLEDGVIILDRQCRIVRYNAAIKKILPSSKASVIGQTCHQFIPCQSSQSICGKSECLASKVFSHGRPARTTYFCETGGHPVWYDILISPIRDESGTITHAIEIWRDVSEIKQVVEDTDYCKEVCSRELERSNLLAHIIEAQEEERKRVARELHDETNQVLTALNLRLENLIQELPIEQEQLHSHLIRLKSDIESIMDNIQEIILDLRPGPLDDLGLIPALRWFTCSKLEPEGIEVNFEISEDQVVLSNEQEITIFRVIQEAVNNILQHAEASQVNLCLQFSDTSIIIQIQDNGRGFQVNETFASKTRSRRLGLVGMRERLSLIGGELEIRSSPQTGTQLQIFVPLHQSGKREPTP